MGTSQIAAIITALALIVIDYISGFVKAAMRHDVSSEKMREGLYHKAAYLLVIIVAEIIQHAQEYVNFGLDVPLVVPACVYIALTELVSIIENIGEINPEIKESKLLQLFRTQEKEE